jgi:hypothetical protein
MNWFEEKQAARKERMEERAERTAAEGRSKYESGFERLRSIPFGQPMMPDHYSYKRDRNFRAKAVGAIDKGCELMRDAEQIAARAEAVGTGGISSDDPEAVVKLKAELAELETRQTTMKAANEAWRKAGNKAGRQPDGTWVEQPNPPYRMSNNSANIRRIQKRIEFLSRVKAVETTERELTGFKVIENTEINRMQFVFPGKPSEAVRGVLKGSGFRWSPTEGAWQRQLTGVSSWLRDKLIEDITKAQEAK